MVMGCACRKSLRASSWRRDRTANIRWRKRFSFSRFLVSASLSNLPRPRRTAAVVVLAKTRGDCCNGDKIRPPAPNSRDVVISWRSEVQDP
jgi:hypothetical protein